MKNIIIAIFLVIFASSSVLALTYDEAKLQNKPIVILFKKNGCPYCKDYEPYFNDMSSKYSSKFNFVKEECGSSSPKIAQQLNVKLYHTVFLLLYQYNKAYPITDRWTLDKILHDYNP